MLVLSMNTIYIYLFICHLQGCGTDPQLIGPGEKPVEPSAEPSAKEKGPRRCHKCNAREVGHDTRNCHKYQAAAAAATAAAPNVSVAASSGPPGQSRVSSAGPSSSAPGLSHERTSDRPVLVRATRRSTRLSADSSAQ
jgi:hypothetical protein